MEKQADVQDTTKWYTQPELAQVLGITPQRVGQLRMQGKLTGAVQRGGTWFYPNEAIREYRRQQK